MRKQLLHFGIILVVLTGINIDVSGVSKRKYPDMTVDISSGGSDYKLTFIYSGANSAICDCVMEKKEKYYLDIYKNGDTPEYLEKRIESGNGHLTADTVEYVTGPQVWGRWALRYESNCDACASNDIFWVWSGFKENQETGEWEPNPALSETDKDTCFNLHIYSVAIYASTEPIKSPANIEASTENFYDKINLTWEKGSEIPDTVMIDTTQYILYYRVYRGSSINPYLASLVATLPADSRSWTDNNVGNGQEYFYWVTTNTDGWNGHESARTMDNYVSGKSKNFSVTASEGTYTGKVKINWDDLSSFSENIRIERSIPKSSDKEEIEILSKNSTSYYDLDIIPGYNYVYYVTPIKSERIFSAVSDTGYILPNGVISGYVKSLQNAGVSNVTVCATLLTDIPDGAIAMPENGYCATTGADGHYEIRNIYYYDKAEFAIVPTKSAGGFTHIFSPDTIIRSLDVSAKTSTGADFTDESSFTVTGRITFPPSPNKVVCGVPDVEIKINNQSRGIYTHANGEWEHSIQEEGTYTFTPVFLHHRFENGAGAASVTYNVNRDISNINFTDMQVDSIKVKVQGGCGNPVSKNFEYATIRITSPGNCYEDILYTDANGLLTISNLPARKYNIQIIDIDSVNTNVMDQIGNNPVSVDLTVRDTAEVITTRDTMIITPGKITVLPDSSTVVTLPDTTYNTIIDTVRSEVIPAADFIYHSPLKITVNFEDAGARVVDCGNDTIVLMEQNVSYPLVFEVVEELGNCPVKEGVLRIFDAVSDQSDKPVEVPIVNGFAFYTVEAGLPEIATSEGTHNHQKFIYVLPEVGFLDADPEQFWVMVTGVQIQAPSFFTRSPELPFLVLHDPPGDKSVATVEEGTEFRSFQTTQVQYGGEAGVYLNTVLGSKVKALFLEGGTAADLKFSLAAGTDEYNREGYETTVTFNKKYSTSDMGNLAGNDGDVYIGASLNQEFAIGDELTFDFDECKPVIRTIPTMDVTGFATTFIYTEKHLRYTLLPKLGELRSLILAGRDTSDLSEEEKIQANQLLFDSLHWEYILARNAYNRDTGAVFKENVSFSAGAPFENTYTSSEKSSESFEYNAFVNLEFAIGAKINFEGGGAWIDIETGVTGKFRWSTKGESGEDATSKRTVGYTLDDGDMGDFFSVDIKEDTAYGVPAFCVVTGTSSCPHEPGTQARDKARIIIDPPQINNVPIGGEAVFTAKLLNQSESRETREYSVQVISTSNPDGALVKLAGQIINFGAASFWMDYNQETNVALTVGKGPLASNYDSIGIMMFPSCEMDLWDEGGDITSGDTAWIFVNFQSECSNVALHLPGDGWMVNQNNNDILDVAFTGYDANNDLLQSITLQYKKEGQGWVDDLTILKNQLTQNFYDYAFDVSNLNDGNYRLRAKSYCGPEGGFSYSSEQRGIIDRTSLAPFGMPTPSDGYLRLGQEISVTFDKDINCDLGSYETDNIKLMRDDSTEIPISVGCYGNKLVLVPDTDLFVQQDLEGVELFAVVSGIQDNNANVQKYTTKWSFLVNVSPVSWNPESVFLSAVETDDVIISANLDNSAVVSKAFTITEWPDWLTPSVKSASILPGNSYTIQLHAVPDLSPGLYNGQVVAMVDDVPEILSVVLELYAEDKNWKVNQSNYEYNMNITAQFSSDEGDINLSTGLRDKIAAYIDGDLRGVGNISYIPELDKFAAFINVYSNIAGKNSSLLEAEENVEDNSVQDIEIVDNGVSSVAERFKKTNWMDFDIYATKDADHLIEFRVASINPSNVELYIDGILLQNIVVPNTGSLAVYNTISSSLAIEKGTHKFRIQSTTGEFDLNWINFPEYNVRNQHCGEVVKFRMWDGLNGIEYGAVEELTFFNNGFVGNAEYPFILHKEGGIQDVELSKGWTWISVNKESPDMSLARVFESITPPTSSNDITLKSQTAYSQYNISSGWLGGLSSVDPRLGYMIYLSSHADTLSMVGSDPAVSSISLNPSWNWIGYPKPGVMSVDDVLDGMAVSEGDILKSQYTFASYNESTETWIGDLKYFRPGWGYKLFVEKEGSVDMLKSVSPGELSREHEYNMTLTAVLIPDGLNSTEGLSLQIFIDGELRGSAPVLYIEAMQNNMAFAMIHGDLADAGKPVDVVLWDKMHQISMPLIGEEIYFSIDKINGTIKNPVLFRLKDIDIPEMDDAEWFTIYPNPFSNQTYIWFSIEEPSHVSLIISNALGTEVARLVDFKMTNGTYDYSFDAGNLPPGIYYFKLRTDKKVSTKKVLLIENK
ncbi:carbohydrate-binding protein [Saccharicrinis sp. FJH62]|uniref:carbohydrate-binding protein n=1 Tax=Saccharicrinis sp. FJH62 TaxID=3344657 RepID=UPI0035D4CFA5